MRPPITLVLTLLAAPLWADSEPRWVHIPDTPQALLRHFGMDPLNCYAAPPVTAHPDLSVQLLHSFNPAYEAVGETRTDYTIVISVTTKDGTITADGQCHSDENRIKCGIACDTGRFQIYDASPDRVIVDIGALGDDCEISGTPPFDTAHFGSAFALDRLDDPTCAALMADLGYE